jgi:hypothetical protein
VKKLLALNLQRPVFSHGQLYSAAMRVPDGDLVIILKGLGDKGTVTQNIVWNKLLLKA